MKHRSIAVALCALALGACGDDGEQAPEVLDLGGERAATREIPTSEAFQSAVGEAIPAVVLIQVEGRPRAAGHPYFPGARPAPADPVPISSGSGVIVSPEGLILTNDHVVREAERVTVLLYDQRQLEARVIARDPSTDIAVLRVEADELPVAELGSSEALGVGEWVLALGSPLGLQFTATAGIVSAKGRALGILAAEGPGQAAPLEYFIQTDAAINPGNSGGPLVNLDGEVVGINTAIISPTGVYAGMGFAIPIELARRVADELVRYGEVRRPFLGVGLDEVGPVDAELYGLGATRGAEVINLGEGGPAERAGLELGDVVVAIGGDEVRTVADLQARLARLSPGDTALLRVVRYGEKRAVPVPLGVVRSGVRPQPAPPLQGEGPTMLGFAVAEGPRGVQIAGVRPNSRAARAGVRPGQLILALNRRPVRSVDDLVAALRTAPGDIVSLVVADPAAGRTILNFRTGA